MRTDAGFWTRIGTLQRFWSLWRGVLFTTVTLVRRSSCIEDDDTDGDDGDPHHGNANCDGDKGLFGFPFIKIHCVVYAVWIWWTKRRFKACVIFAVSDLHGELVRNVASSAVQIYVRWVKFGCVDGHITSDDMLD